MTDKPDTDLHALWTQQPTEVAPMSLDAIHAGARKFQSLIFWRNVREYAAGILVMVMFGWFAVTAANPIVQAGAVLTVLGAAFVTVYLYLHGRSDRAGARMAEGCVDFHRTALIRQRDLLRSVWLWYLLPFVPGMAVFMWGVEQSQGSFQPWRMAVKIGLLMVVFAGVGLLNMWGARRLQKEIARLSD